MVEGAALEMLCTQVPRVRIPNSPPEKSLLSFDKGDFFNDIRSFLFSDISRKYGLNNAQYPNPV